MRMNGNNNETIVICMYVMAGKYGNSFLFSLLQAAFITSRAFLYSPLTRKNGIKKHTE